MKLWMDIISNCVNTKNNTLPIAENTITTLTADFSKYVKYFESVLAKFVKFGRMF